MKKRKNRLGEKQKSLIAFFAENDKKGSPYVGSKQIAEGCGYQHPQAISRAIQILEKRGDLFSYKKDGDHRKCISVVSKRPKEKEDIKSKLTKKQKTILDFFIDNDKKGSPYVSWDAVAIATGYKVRQNVNEVIETLSRKGVLVINRKPGSRRRFVSVNHDRVTKDGVLIEQEPPKTIKFPTVRASVPDPHIVSKKSKKDVLVQIVRAATPTVGKFDLVKTLEKRNEILQAEVTEIKENRDFLLDENQKLSSIRESWKGADDIPGVLEENKARIESLEKDKLTRDHMIYYQIGEIAKLQQRLKSPINLLTRLFRRKKNA